MDHQWEIVIWHKEAFVGVHPVSTVETTIGRGVDNAVHLPDAAVSRAHAVLVKTDGKFLIRDLGSRNGTYMKDLPIQSDELLHAASEVRIGPYRLRISPRRDRAANDVEWHEDSTCSNQMLVESLSEIELREQQLTPAQLRVYKELLKGHSEKEVATALGIGTNTVHTHSRAVYVTFKVSSRAELMAYCAVRIQSGTSGSPTWS